MKLGDFRKILDAAAHIYREAGNEAAAGALKEISGLCNGRDSMQVTAFAKLVADHRPANGS
jgi:hypothetical protein